ncbi:Seminal metalloprotease 1 [Eumeta japonica]|uniref:Metalloendopeptidase n=1 Tax=Eumeta variegata TaxID=151549 RepID=A0A4C1UNM2_EUMVA|nr:Seminal metalloprotease 1 [Eumeta japonica]
MLRLSLVVLAVGLAAAVPPVTRSRNDIEAFRSFLESTKIGGYDDRFCRIVTKTRKDANLYIQRATANPAANAEENSGKYEGDIVLDDFIIEDMLAQYAQGRNAYTWPNTHWPNDTVVWEFGEGEFGRMVGHSRPWIAVTRAEGEGDNEGHIIAHAGVESLPFFAGIILARGHNLKTKSVLSILVHVLVHEFMSIYYALAGWSGNRERTKRKRGKEKGPLQQAAIEAGIKDIEENSCIKFRYREPEDTVFVRLTGHPNGCYAHVGYWASRGVHTLNLARNTPGVGCFRHATIVHEWLHILGFLHMQSTYNRDDYVQIVEENLQPGTEHNFAIYTSDLVSNLDVEYDYVSCMHYGPFAFSVNGLPTIVALREHEGVMGQREYITEKDWIRLRRHYNCPGAWD